MKGANELEFLVREGKVPFQKQNFDQILTAVFYPQL